MSYRQRTHTCTLAGRQAQAAPHTHARSHTHARTQRRTHAEQSRAELSVCQSVEREWVREGERAQWRGRERGSALTVTKCVGRPLVHKPGLKIGAGAGAGAGSALDHISLALSLSHVRSLSLFEWIAMICTLVYGRPSSNHNRTTTSVANIIILTIGNYQC